MGFGLWELREISTGWGVDRIFGCAKERLDQELGAVGFTFPFIAVRVRLMGTRSFWGR